MRSMDRIRSMLWPDSPPLVSGGRERTEVCESWCSIDGRRSRPAEDGMLLTDGLRCDAAAVPMMLSSVCPSSAGYVSAAEGLRDRTRCCWEAPGGSELRSWARLSISMVWDGCTLFTRDGSGGSENELRRTGSKMRAIASDNSDGLGAAPALLRRGRGCSARLGGLSDAPSMARGTTGGRVVAIWTGL